MRRDRDQTPLGTLVQLALQATALRVRRLDDAAARRCELLDAGAHLGSQADVRHGDSRRSRDRLGERGIVKHAGVVDEYGDVLATPVDRRDRAVCVCPGEGKRPPTFVDVTLLVRQPIAEL